MRSFTIQENRLLPPFNEPAREITVIGVDRIPTALKLHHKELKERCLGQCPTEEDLHNISELPQKLNLIRSGVTPNDEIFVYRDNIYFDLEYLEHFLKEARATGHPCRAALPADDPAWTKYAFPLSSLQKHKTEDGRFYYPIDIWYFPKGWAPPDKWYPLFTYSDCVEKGYYNTPDTMTNVKDAEAGEQQDLTHYQSERTCVVIESWVHLFNAMIPLGVFSFGSRFEEYLKKHNFYAIRLLLQAILEQKQMRSTSKMVQVGKGTRIDPSAVILGPTVIGQNCDIGPGVVIDNCVIGDNVTIAQGCQLMLSIVGTRCFLPFRASLFMTFIMESTIVAQNTCLQMCLVGKNSFIGAGSTFTDFNLLPSPIKAPNYEGKIEDIRQPVLGGCVGHNCRLGAGMVIYPARMIESDVILTASPERRVIMKEVTYEMSDHHKLPPRISVLHQRLYGRETDGSELLEEW
jgi:carbonic anhydrase/acetyltransferase-like protein (isoleucine patch superfamily)